MGSSSSTLTDAKLAAAWAQIELVLRREAMNSRVYTREAFAAKFANHHPAMGSFGSISSTVKRLSLHGLVRYFRQLPGGADPEPSAPASTSPGYLCVEGMEYAPRGGGPPVVVECQFKRNPHSTGIDPCEGWGSAQSGAAERLGEGQGTGEGKGATEATEQRRGE